MHGGDELMILFFEGVSVECLCFTAWAEHVSVTRSIQCKTSRLPIWRNITPISRPITYVSVWHCLSNVEESRNENVDNRMYRWFLKMSSQYWLKLGAVWFTKCNAKGNGNGLHLITVVNKFE
jgi:hypothetical protein